MAVFNLINDWLDNLHENVDTESDQFVVALSDTPPASETTPPTGDGAGVLANVTEVAYTNLSTRNLTTVGSSQTGGTYTLDFDNITLTSSGGSTGPFRYIYIYDDTVATPVDPLVCYYDYGSSITLADGESLEIQFSASGLYNLS